MIRSHIQNLISDAVSALVAEGKIPAAAYQSVEIADPRSPEHGDYASNFAMVNAKAASMNPRTLGEALAEALSAHADFESVEVAGPGFLNLRLKPETISRYVADVLAAGTELSHSRCADPLKINVEFVSVNPNGPITVASGRGAAFGSTVCRVLQAVGHEVHREYYINDGVNSTQMQRFAESVRCLALGQPVPDDGYKGDYVEGVAASLTMALQQPWLSMRKQGYVSGELGYRTNSGAASAYNTRMAAICEQIIEKVATRLDRQDLIRSLSREELQRICEWQMVAEQGQALTAFGVEFDTWFSEQSLHDAGMVEKCIDEMVAKGVADDEPYRTVLKMGKRGEVQEVNKEEQAVETDDGPNEEEDEERGTSDEQTGSDSRLAIGDSGGSAPQTPTLWLRSTKFADDMDRVIRRKDGRLTYIASDVAYHKDKFNRPEGADKLITVLGPDHHGYINRLRAVVAALLEHAGESRIANRESQAGNPLEGPDAAIYRSPEERDACRAALAEAEKKLEVVIFQLVRFLKDGKQAPMRKRDGNIYALIDLIDELGKTMAPNGDQEEQQRVGRDIARFFYLMRSHDSNIDFDLDLATKQSDENPVFYAQYAHARICSVERKAAEGGMGFGVWGMGDGTGAERIGGTTPPVPVVGSTVTDPSQEGNGRDAGSEIGDRKSEIGNPGTPDPKPQTLDPKFALLTHPKELALIKKIVDLPYEVRRCAEDYGVHRLTTFAVELARTYHGFYDNCRVIAPENPELSLARLALCKATRLALQSVFNLLGISAPERMERAAAEANGE